MAEYGKSVKSLKDDIATHEATSEELQTQLDARDKDLKTLREEVGDGDLKKQFEELETRYEEDTKKLNEQIAKNKKLSEIKLGVTKQGAKNEKAVMALIDVDQVKIDDNGVHGLKEQLDALSESDPYLFQSQNDPSGQSSVGGNNGGGKPPKEDAFKAAAKKYI